MTCIFKNINLFLIFAMVANSVFSQTDVLEVYVQQGLRDNLVLRQRHLSYENAMNGLKQTRSFYYPSINFETLYTTAEGGRSINLPIGDLVNPVYNTLNQLTGQNAFPEVQNEKINFLPKNYYDAHARISMPIINIDIRNNTRLQHKQVAIKEKEIEIYQRELIKDIKTAYYNYLSAEMAVKIYQSAVNLAEEGKRTNEKMIAAGTGLHAYVLRSETEIAQARAKQTAAELRAKTLQRYFNALLNRDAHALIEIDDHLSGELLIDRDAPSASQREELKSLDAVFELHELLVKMNRQEFIPKLNAFSDFGAQSEQLQFNNQSLYFMVGVQLSFPIFTGGRNKLKIEEAKNEAKISKLERDYVEQQLDVAVTKALNEALTQQSGYASALKQLDMAQTYFRLIDKGYNAGVNTYIETVDARSQLISAQLNVSVHRYQLLSAMAVLERETASYPLPK